MIAATDLTFETVLDAVPANQEELFSPVDRDYEQWLDDTQPKCWDDEEWLRQQEERYESEAHMEVLAHEATVNPMGVL